MARLKANQKKGSLLDTSQSSSHYYYVNIEKPSYCSMKISDYFTYLKKRERALSSISAKRLEEGVDPLNPVSADDTFGRSSYYSSSSNTDTDDSAERKMECDRDTIVQDEWLEVAQLDRSSMKVNVVDTCLYLTDYDLVENMPLHYQDLLANFALPGVFPGGSLCMMNAVSN